MYVCMYVCVNVCMYVCMYECIYVYMYICIYVYMHVCMYVSMYVCMYARISQSITSMSVCLHVDLPLSMQSSTHSNLLSAVWGPRRMQTVWLEASRVRVLYSHFPFRLRE